MTATDQKTYSEISATLSDIRRQCEELLEEMAIERGEAGNPS